MSQIQLFISTVSDEFASYRDVLRSTLERHNVAVKVQEDFISTGTETLDKLDQYIQVCSAVVHLAGDMTGSWAKPPALGALMPEKPDQDTADPFDPVPLLREALRTGTPLSYTQWEAYLAVYHHKVLLIAIPHANAPRDPKYYSDETQRASQKAHIERLRAMGRFAEIEFMNVHDLTAKIALSTMLDLLARAEAERTAPTPFPKAPRVQLPDTDVEPDQLRGRTIELHQLDEAWENDATHIVSLVAMGGVGKTALLKEWLRRMLLRWRGAVRVYGWSFYSQGTSDKVVSADLFMQSALDWFGDPNPNTGAPRDKGERLAHHIRKERTLLVLDGLEPLQHPPGREEGKLKDEGLKVLLTELANHNPGLCLISTRIAVTHLKSFEPMPALRIPLETLSPADGALLLTDRGVVADNIQELKDASQEFGGHCLALTLLGSYLERVHGGNIRERKNIGPLEQEIRNGGHARRVMASYEQWFGEGPKISLLRLMGLFDRPVDGAVIKALRQGLAIPNLTTPLHGLSDKNWKEVVSDLRRLRLLARESNEKPDMLDSHPLVRQHFGERLKETNPEGWREGNNRLFEYLKDSTPDRPESIDELERLFTAVTHGCQAGRHQEALDQIYRERIQRGDELWTSRQHGAFGSELASMANFFIADSQWTKLVDGLPDESKAYLLEQVGFALRSLGWLREAVQPMAASVAMGEQLGDWKHAAERAVYLRGIYLTQGELEQALVWARKSVELADKAEAMALAATNLSFKERTVLAHWRISNRTAHADVLHQLGKLGEAEASFGDAERLQREKSNDIRECLLQEFPQQLLEQFPLLRSLPAVGFFDVIGGDGEYANMRQALSDELVELICLALSRLPPMLHGVEGFRYCELLLSCGRYAEVQTRAIEAIRYAQRTKPLHQLTIAFNRLALGRAYLLQAQCEAGNTYLQAEETLEQAVKELRNYGREDLVPLALVARAELYRILGNFKRAQEDLKETLDLAVERDMKLHFADCQLSYARYYFDCDDKAKAETCLAEARLAVNQTGYHRRDPELDELEVRRRHASSIH